MRLVIFDINQPPRLTSVIADDRDKPLIWEKSMSVKKYTRTTFVLLILLAIGLPGKAQVGIKAGIGISDIAFLEEGQTPYLGYEINSLEHRLPKVSYQVGAFHIIDVSKRIDFQPELLFSLQGLDYSKDYLYDDITYKINISYLRLPLLVKYKTSLKENRYPGIFAGPYVSCKLSAMRVKEVEGQREESKMTNVKDSDFGIVAGYSFGYGLPSGRLVIDFRSSYSLVNMMEPIEGHIPRYYGPSKEYVRNVNVSLVVGYYFLQTTKDE